jgi:hypothetical protein
LRFFFNTIQTGASESFTWNFVIQNKKTVLIKLLLNTGFSDFSSSEILFNFSHPKIRFKKKTNEIRQLRQKNFS